LFCTKCGSKNKSGSSFCIDCGSAFSLGSDQKLTRGFSDSVTPAGPEKRKSLTAGQIVAISAAGMVALAVFGVGSVMLLTGLSGDDYQISEEDSVDRFIADGTYGSSAYLDSLWDGCEEGDFESCDALFMDSPSDSEYEEFGDTCGYRNEPAGYCVDLYLSSGGSNSDSSSGSGSSSYGTYGSDSYLDSLWVSCSNADFDACDTLFMDSPSDSEYEYFGDTCGYRNEPSGYCVDLYN